MSYCLTYWQGIATACFAAFSDLPLLLLPKHRRQPETFPRGSVVLERVVPPRRAAFSSLSTAAAGPVAGLGLSANQHSADLLRADFAPWLSTQVGGLPSAAAEAFIGSLHPEMWPSNRRLPFSGSQRYSSRRFVDIFACPTQPKPNPTAPRSTELSLRPKRFGRARGGRTDGRTDGRAVWGPEKVTDDHHQLS